MLWDCNYPASRGKLRCEPRKGEKGKGFNDTLCVPGKVEQYIWFPCVAVTRTFRNKPLFRVKTPFGANHDILIELFTRTLPFNGTSDLLLEVNGKT